MCTTCTVLCTCLHVQISVLDLAIMPEGFLHKCVCVCVCMCMCVCVCVCACVSLYIVWYTMQSSDEVLHEFHGNVGITITVQLLSLIIHQQYDIGIRTYVGVKYILHVFEGLINLIRIKGKEWEKEEVIEEASEILPLENPAMNISIYSGIMHTAIMCVLNWNMQFTRSG